MKNWKNLLIYSIMAAACLFITTSCHRTSREVWEDTKTCSRYIERGWRSLLGQHIDAREYAPYQTVWEEEKDFVPLANATSPTFQEMGAAFSPPKDAPGDPGSEIPGIQAFSKPLGQLAKLFQTVHFETDHFTISGSENVQKLTQIAHFLTKNPKLYVFIEGHADERGAAAYNLALGSKRANAIRSFLIQNGVSPNQLFTVSYGKERPLSLNHDELAWQQNRRGEFKIYEK